MRRVLVALALLMLLFAATPAHGQVGTATEGFIQVTPGSVDVPGYGGANPAETGYGHGQMFDAAKGRALQSHNMDGEAARTITRSFAERPFVPTDPNAPWFRKAGEGARNPGRYFEVLEGESGGCGNSNILAGDTGREYRYTCTAAAFRNKHGVEIVLRPVCRDKRTECWSVTSSGDSILPYRKRGGRIRIGRHGENAIEDAACGIVDGNVCAIKRGRTKENTYRASLTFTINDLREVNRFALKDITYEDFVRIVFNGEVVFSDLDRAQYTKVDQCEGCHTINRRVSQRLDFNLRPFLKEGRNRLDVVLTAVAHGELLLNIHTSASCCRNWQDQWQKFSP